MLLNVIRVEEKSKQVKTKMKQKKCFKSRRFKFKHKPQPQSMIKGLAIFKPVSKVVFGGILGGFSASDVEFKTFSVSNCRSNNSYTVHCVRRRLNKSQTGN